MRTALDKVDELSTSARFAVAVMKEQPAEANAALPQDLFDKRRRTDEHAREEWLRRGRQLFCGKRGWGAKAARKAQSL